MPASGYMEKCDNCGVRDPPVHLLVKVMYTRSKPRSFDEQYWCLDCIRLKGENVPVDERAPNTTPTPNT
jgi:hypothetical protein